MCLNESKSEGEFLLALEAEPDESQFKHSHQGNSDDDISWVVKAHFDGAGSKISILEPESKSLLIYNEYA